MHGRHLLASLAAAVVNRKPGRPYGWPAGLSMLRRLVQSLETKGFPPFTPVHNPVPLNFPPDKRNLYHLNSGGHSPVSAHRKFPRLDDLFTFCLIGIIEPGSLATYMAVCCTYPDCERVVVYRANSLNSLSRFPGSVLEAPAGLDHTWIWTDLSTRFLGTMPSNSVSTGESGCLASSSLFILPLFYCLPITLLTPSRASLGRRSRELPNK